MINFTRAFDTAWERMHVILFRPVDPAKWLLIGFNVFLALLAEGGVTINNSIPYTGKSQTNYRFESLPAFLHALKQSMTWLSSFTVSPWIALYIFGGLIYIAAWLALNWVGCRAQFIVLDNIVRNRGALADPWTRYARHGNMWFLVHLGLALISTILLGLVTAGFFALNWAWIYGERVPTGGEVTVIIVYVVALFLGWIVWASITFLIQTFVIPVYFKQSQSVGAAFSAVVRLIARDPLSVACYLALNFVLTIAAAFVSMLVCCVAGCVIVWLACIPFFGSMALSVVLCQLILPVMIFLRCFQLDCLAQFGPEYDVWTVDVPPSLPPPPV